MMSERAGFIPARRVGMISLPVEGECNLIDLAAEREVPLALVGRVDRRDRVAADLEGFEAVAEGGMRQLAFTGRLPVDEEFDRPAALPGAVRRELGLQRDLSLGQRQRAADG